MISRCCILVRSNSSDCIKIPGGVMPLRTSPNYSGNLKNYGRAQSSQTIYKESPSHYSHQGMGRSVVDGYQGYDANFDAAYRKRRKDSFSSGRSSPTSSVTSELSTRSGSSSSLASSLTLTSFEGRYAVLQYANLTFILSHNALKTCKVLFLLPVVNLNHFLYD